MWSTRYGYPVTTKQTTGGGHFPSKDAHAETALNIFQANVVPMLNLDREGVEYDIVQVCDGSWADPIKRKTILQPSSSTLCQICQKCPIQGKELCSWSVRPERSKVNCPRVQHGHDLWYGGDRHEHHGRQWIANAGWYATWNWFWKNIFNLKSHKKH